MRIMKQAKYSLKAQVEKDDGPSGEGQSPRVEKDEAMCTYHLFSQNMQVDKEENKM